MADQAGGDDPAKKTFHRPGSKSAGAASKREIVRLIVHERCPVELFELAAENADSCDECISSGVVFDITWKGVGLIVNNRLAANIRVLIRFQSPRHQGQFNARVAWCAELPSTNRVLKPQAGAHFRMGLQFLPRNESEKASLAALALSL